MRPIYSACRESTGFRIFLQRFIGMPDKKWVAGLQKFYHSRRHIWLRHVEADLQVSWGNSHHFGATQVTRPQPLVVIKLLTLALALVQGYMFAYKTYTKAMVFTCFHPFHRVSILNYVNRLQLPVAPAHLIFVILSCFVMFCLYGDQESWT